MPEVLLAGVSMRAAAVSARRAGFDAWSVDAFRDLDCAGRGSRVPLDADGRFDAHQACTKAQTVVARAVVYGSGFEDEPGAVARISEGRTLWGNPPDVLRRVRAHRDVLARLARRGFAVPRTLARAEATAGAVSTDVAWLEKPERSGGGHDIRRWHPETSVADTSYLEEFIDGEPGSIVFVAAGGRAVALGISRQIAGDAAFGARGYRYCGSILSDPRAMFEHGLAVAANAHALAQAVTEDHGLVGLNCLDFVARGGVAYPLEINPRWSASMELIERAHGVSMFRLHALACSRQELPVDRAHLCLRRAVGKAIVFARRVGFVKQARAWLNGLDVADIPRSRTLLQEGDPICTVFAETDDVDGCYRGLVQGAKAVYTRASYGVTLPTSVYRLLDWNHGITHRQL